MLIQTCLHVSILIVIIIHVYADSPKVPTEPKTGRKQPATVSKARASVKAAGTYAGLMCVHGVGVSVYIILLIEIPSPLNYDSFRHV